MSQTLSKEERLKLRQEQLAKWKQRKSQSPVLDPERSTDEEDRPNASLPNPEEQRRIERLKKLEEWRKKKLLSQESKPTGAQNRQKKLEEWKRKRENDNPNDSSKVTVSTPLKPISTLTRKPVLLKRQRLFEDDEDENGGLRFKLRRSAPQSMQNAMENTLDGKDALDLFLEELKDDYVDPNQEFKQVLEESLDDEDEGEDKLLSLQLKTMRKGKELAAVDHKSIAYLPFKKNFYVESREVTDLSQKEVHDLRTTLGGIKVSGTNCPRPIWKWEQLGMSSVVTSVIEDKLQFKKPTSVQSQALPVILSGRDMLAIAKTGSGKTLAFVLPLLRHVQDQPPLKEGDGPIALLMAPTRELALQIFKQLTIFTKKLGLSACCCYGGSSIEPQIAELRRGAQIVVCTPGRLIDLLSTNNGKVCNLRRVTYVVLDEADRMFDFGFEPQIKKIFSQVRPDKQCVLFSATFARKMEGLAKDTLQDPVEVVVGGISIVAPEIRQHVELFEIDHTASASELYDQKFSRLQELLEQFSGVKKLVFVEKQDSADDLHVKLLSQGLQSVTIHGGKDQIDRKYAIKEFSEKNSGVDTLIATSVAARGLDVKGLDLVINFDPPNHMEDYVHRVGRTGRAGQEGDAYTFVASSQERPVTDLVKSLRLSKYPEDKIDSRLIKISEEFLLKVKDGKERFNFGFGGKGLSKLDEMRDTQKKMERSMYAADTPEQEKPAKAHSPATSNPVPENAKTVNGVELPDFNVIEGKAAESTGPDKCKFHSRITVNDLPQQARWAVVSGDSLAEITEATSTSITSKGQFYPSGSKIPTIIKQGKKEVPAPPKLYLLVEGLTESGVRDANKRIRQKIIEGMEISAKDDGVAPTGRYVV